MVILLGLVTIAIVVLMDYSEHKEPFDAEDATQEFDIKKHWWVKRNDNVFIMIGLGLVGMILSNELALPIINDFLSWPSLAEHAAELTGVFIVTFVFAKHFKRLLGFKK